MNMASKGQASKGPKIHCAHDKMSPVDSLVENPRNPNKHSPRQILLLSNIIAGQGWRAPIVVSKRSGFVVAGHARLKAAKVLELQTVPVNVQPFESEADEWAHLIADNRIAELAEMDTASLKDLLIRLDTGEINMELTGYDPEALNHLMEELDGPERGARPIICPECKHEFSVKST